MCVFQDSGVSHAASCQNGLVFIRDQHARQEPGHRLGSQSAQVHQYCCIDQCVLYMCCCHGEIHYLLWVYFYSPLIHHPLSFHAPSSFSCLLTLWVPHEVVLPLQPSVYSFPFLLPPYNNQSVNQSVNLYEKVERHRSNGIQWYRSLHGGQGPVHRGGVHPHTCPSAVSRPRSEHWSAAAGRLSCADADLRLKSLLWPLQTC